MGKTGRKNKVYSAEFKIGVIMDDIKTIINTEGLVGGYSKDKAFRKN